MKMSPERYERAKALFLAVGEVDSHEREAYLDQACADNAELRADVQMLISHDESGTSFMNHSPAIGIDHDHHLSQGSNDETQHAHPERIGSFRILEVIGRGGMGVIYKAEQARPQRTVALKVIGGIASTRTVRRLENEAELLARLQHPGIAQIFEAGVFDTGFGSQPYFAMELIEGRPLTAYAQERELATDDRLRLLAQVCDAVQHAHQRGVIHRDLKPANILVDDSGQVKVLDFGIARSTESDVQATAMHTVDGQLVGTLPYMSPEQVSGSPREIDLQSDVYALGVIGYELLCGELPFDLRDKLVPEAARIIRDEEPRSPSTINRILAGEIEVIILKAMAREKSHRYESAGEFAADIRRYFNNEPIHARPPHLWYVVRKLIRRRRVAVITLTAIVISAMLGGAAIWRNRVAQRNQQYVDDMLLCMNTLNSFRSDLRNGQYGAQLDAKGSRIEELIEHRLDRQALIQGSLFSQLAQAYQGAGLYAQAIPVFRKAHEVRAQYFGEGSPDALSMLCSLVCSLRDNGELQESFQLAEQGARLASSLTKPHLQHRFQYFAAEAIHDMGRAALAEGRADDAERFLAEAAARYRSALSNQLGYVAEPSDTDILDSKGSLGILLIDQGKELEEGMALIREALNARTGEQFGSTVSEAWMRHYLGRGYLVAGKIDDALRELRVSLEMRQSSYHKGHPHILESKNKLGLALCSAGQLEPGIALLTQAADGAKAILRPGHWRISAYARDVNRWNDALRASSSTSDQ